MLTRRQFAQASALVLIGAPGLSFSSATPRFPYGVASGDPLADRVILWSAIGGYDTRVEAGWEVSPGPDFTRILRRGSVSTGPESAHTLKVDVDGLSPGQTYYFRFEVDGQYSMTGRTKTLPGDETDVVKLAVVSCSNYPAGYFNVYRAIGHRNDLDAVVHVGDYLYEYPADGYASERAAEFGRLSDPLGELLSLGDYRRRHAQYKSDPDLQYAHARQPFIAIWDDHELANDAWQDGAENHDSSEGPWPERRRAALQAYYEWMPIRARADLPPEAAYRAFDFGRLLTLAMIETRLVARSRPLDYATDLPQQRIWFDLSDPQRARAIDHEPAELTADIASLPLAFDLGASPAEPIRDYGKLKRWAEAGAMPDGFGYLPDTERFEQTVITAPDRELVGSTQFDWLAEVLDGSARRAVAFRAVGNQTLVSPIRAPDLDSELSAPEKAALPDYIRKRISLSRYRLALNLDSWDGYPAERERLLALTADTGRTLILSGDSHNAWAAPLRRDSGKSAGFEFATSSVSSPGIAEALNLPGARLAALFAESNPHFSYIEMAHRGYLLVSVTKHAASGEFHLVNRTDDRRFFVRNDQRIEYRG